MIHQISPDAPDSISTKLDETPRLKAHNTRALWKEIFGQDSDDSDDDESYHHPQSVKAALAAGLSCCTALLASEYATCTHHHYAHPSAALSLATAL